MMVNFILIVSFAIIFTSCQPEKEIAEDVKISDDKILKSELYDTDKSETFVCDYMDQKVPGNVPVRFAPDIVSTKKDDSCFEISISGKEIIFSRDGKIYISNQDQDGKWNLPEPMFNGGESSFSKDGQKIYFNSRAPVPGSKVSLTVWYSIKQGEKWSAPAHLTGETLNQVIHAPSFAANGNIYSSGVNFSKYKNKNYQKAVQLNPPVKGSHPFISSDESFMIFDKKPPGGGYGADLYISFQKGDSTWTEPVWLGDKINTDKLETNAYVTPDGKYMFFTRSFDIYWVDAGFINRIKMSVLM